MRPTRQCLPYEEVEGIRVLRFWIGHSPLYALSISRAVVFSRSARYLPGTGRRRENKAGSAESVVFRHTDFVGSACLSPTLREKTLLFGSSTMWLQ